jgi:hypothetical protein
VNPAAGRVFLWPGLDTGVAPAAQATATRLVTLSGEISAAILSASRLRLLRPSTSRRARVVRLEHDDT